MADNLDADLAIVVQDPETKEFKATPYFEDYLYKLVATVGGEGSTIISDLVKTTIASDKLDYIFGLVKQLQINTAEFINKIKTSDYTAENKDWIEARNKAVISLPANPLIGDQVIVSNGDGSSIVISGNGNNIKYTSIDISIKINRNGSSLHFQYFIDNAASEEYWRVI